MEPLISSDDVEARLGRAIASDEEDRVVALIADVSASIRTYTGQSFSLLETAELVKVRRTGSALLSQRPVVSITSVKDHNDNDVSYQWFESDDRIHIGLRPLDDFTWVPYSTPLRKVLVTYEHGDETVPDVIIGIAAAIVCRTLGHASTDAGVVEEQIDGYRYRLASASGAGAYGLLADEKVALDGYRRVLGGFKVAI